MYGLFSAKMCILFDTNIIKYFLPDLGLLKFILAINLIWLMAFLVVLTFYFEGFPLFQTTDLNSVYREIQLSPYP